MNNATEVELSLLNDQVDMFDFSEHGSWLLVYPKETIVRIRGKDANINLKAYHQITLTMKRRPDVIMLYSAVPGFLTVLLNTMTYTYLFQLKVERGQASYSLQTGKLVVDLYCWSTAPNIWRIFT